MNRAFLVGNLTKDPELSTTANGFSVCKFTIAVTRRYNNSDGSREADFLPIICWRGQADNCGKYLRKGSKVAICGSIQIRNYESDGSKKYVTEIIADEVQFLSSKNDIADEVGELPEAKPTRNISSLKAIDDEDGDLPF